MAQFEDANRSALRIFWKASLPSTTEEREIAAFQQNVLVRNALYVGLVNLISTTIVLFVFWRFSHAPALVAWYVGMSAISVSSVLLWRKTRAGFNPTRVRGRMLQKAEWVAIVTGLAWGSLAFIVEPGHPEVFLFVVIIAVGKAAAFMTITNSVPRIASRFSCGCIAPVMVASLFQLPVFASAIIILGGFMLILLVRGSIASFEQLRTLVASRTEAQKARADLVDAIESVDDAFAIYDSSARLKLSNSRFREWFPKDAPLSLESDGRERMIGNGRWVLSSVEKVNDGGYVAIHTDISALKNRERELIVARREAEEASAAKDRFLATMSHELRAPLNLINGFSRLLTSDSRIAMTKDEIANYGDQIHRAGNHLQTVVNDIIEFSDVGAQAQAYHPEVLDVRDVIERAAGLAAAFQSLPDTRGIEIDVEPDLGAIVADEKAIQRILMNLISNAIRFGGDPVRVIVRACLRPDGAPLVSVRDFGYGLTAEELSQVFEPFYQCARNRNGEFLGTGLGLTISRELARMHDGDVLLSSRLQGGTTATLILPPKAHVANTDHRDAETGAAGPEVRSAIG